MNRSFGSRVFGAATMIAAFLFAGPVSADDLLASRLSALLGQEREALSVIPSSRLNALTTLPREGGSADGTTFDYSNEMLAALPAATGGPQWKCLTEALYFEARGETVRGLFAVGEVILNRVESARYPDTLCTVINQGTGARYACQFTYTCDGRAEIIHEQAAWEKVGKVARLLMDGAPLDLTDGATHYHTTAVRPSWARVFPKTAQIGSHIFYRETSNNS